MAWLISDWTPNLGLCKNWLVEGVKQPLVQRLIDWFNGKCDENISISIPRKEPETKPYVDAYCISLSS